MLSIATYLITVNIYLGSYFYLNFIW